MRDARFVACVLSIIFFFAGSRVFASANYDIQIKQGDILGARKTIDSLIRLRGETALLLFAKAQCCLNADSAAALYKSIFQKYPHDTCAAYALLRLAQYYTIRKEPAPALVYVNSLKQRFPDSWEYAQAKEALAPAEQPAASQNHVQTLPKPDVSTAPTRVQATPKSDATVPPQQKVTYAVQLGVFSVQKNAERIQILANKTAATDIVQHSRNGSSLYVVLAGSYKSKDQATEAVNTLEKSTGVKGFVVLR